jgi:2'-5' RNA ligase superfamily
MRDHWWWRPGWRLGRRAYTFHITFEDDEAVVGGDDLRRLAADYQRAVASLPGLDLVPLRWLHLTMQNVAFTDEVAEHDVAGVLAAAQKLCGQLEPFQLACDDAEVRQEAIALRLAPAAPVSRLRDTLRSAIQSVLGTVPEAPEHAHGFEPHISLAYSNLEGASEPYVSAIAGLRPATVSVRVLAAKLIVLDRDERVYRWSTYGEARLGGPEATGL